MKDVPYCNEQAQASHRFQFVGGIIQSHIDPSLFRFSCVKRRGDTPTASYSPSRYRKLGQPHPEMLAQCFLTVARNLRQCAARAEGKGLRLA